MTRVRFRINGVIVIAKDKDHDGKIGRQLWLDDTTATVCVLLSPRLCRRREANELKVGKLVSLFGSVVSEGEKLVVQCGGFHIEDDPLIEIHHWLMVIQANPNLMAPMNKAPSPSPEITTNPRQEQNPGPNLQQLAFVGQHRTLLSQPSPNRGPTHHLAIQPSSSTDDFFNNDIDEEDGEWNWSPDHTFASSTPLSRLQHQSILASSEPAKSTRASPLRSEIYKNADVADPILVQQASNFGFDDSFDADDLEDLERNALELVDNNPAKRTFDKVN